jgi:chromosome condensin MukBEF complex kleisin-like MukF subunit
VEVQDQLEQQDRQDHWDRKVTFDQADKLDLLVHQVLKDQQVFQGCQDQLGQLVNQDHLETLVPQEHLVTQDLKEILELQDLLELQGRMVYQVLRDQPDHLGQTVVLAHQEQLDLQDQ